MTDRNFKRVEHRRKCRLCWETAQLCKEGRFYCALCYHAVFQATPVDQGPAELTPALLMSALNNGAITGRAAASLLDRILKERTV